MGGVEQILQLCEDAKEFSEIQKALNWQKGAVSTALARLIESGMIEREERGLYRTTLAGFDYLEKKYAKMRNEEDSRLRLAAINILHKRDLDSIIRIWPIPIKYLKPSNEIKKLHKILHTIYHETAERESDKLNIRNPYAKQLIRDGDQIHQLIWLEIQDMPSFFPSICESYLDQITSLCKRKVSPKEIFRVLKFFSLPLKERIKYNLRNI